MTTKNKIPFGMTSEDKAKELHYYNILLITMIGLAFLSIFLEIAYLYLIFFMFYFILKMWIVVLRIKKYRLFFYMTGGFLFFFMKYRPFLKGDISDEEFLTRKEFSYFPVPLKEIFANEKAN